MEIKLSEKLEREIFGVTSYGYGGVKEFVEDAIRRRIFELKKSVSGRHKTLSQADQKIAKITTGFVERYRKDLEALAKK